MLAQIFLVNTATVEHVEYLVVAQRVINVDGNHAQFLLALEVLVFLVIDGQNVEEFELEHFGVRPVVVVEPEVIGQL